MNVKLIINNIFYKFKTYLIFNILFHDMIHNHKIQSENNNNNNNNNNN